jgi:uncharacterized protein YndB with AHSA1/START domain
LHIDDEGDSMSANGMISDTIERSILIAAPAEQVWQVVSVPGWWINDGNGLDLSLVDVTAEDQAVVHHPEFGDIAVERLAAVPARTVSFRWTVSGSAERRVDVPADQLLHTRVDFTLTEEPGGTRLHVVESGFAGAPVSAEVRRNAYEGNSEGWDIELRVFKAHVEHR